MKKILEFIKEKKIALIITLIAATCIVGAIDYFTGYGLSFSLFYLLCIAIASWKVGRFAGMFIAILAALLWCTGDFLAGKEYRYFFTPYWNFAVRVGLFTVSTYTISKLNSVLKKESRYARRDFITGIANWQAFSEVASREIERLRRYKRPLTIAYIDCDNFKNINDTLGHQAGDDFLRSLAKAIQGNIRTIDMAARLGGDEFAVLLPETDYNSAEIVIDRLRELLLGKISDAKNKITYSIGAATFIHAPDSVESMVKKADALMYQAKGLGKNKMQHELYRDANQ